MKSLPIILIQHAEDGSHLWNVRSTAVASADYTRRNLMALDERLEASLDGLQIGGAEGWDTLKNETGWRTPGDVFCATVLALGVDNPQPLCWSEVLAAVTAEPELARGVISGLGWLSFQRVEAPIGVLLSDASPMLQRLGIAAMACHRRDPGQRLRAALTSPTPELRARALKAAGELGRADLLPFIAEYLGETDPDVRFWGAWAHALLSVDAKPISTLRLIAESSHPRSEYALELALARMTAPAAKEWITVLMKKPAMHRLACLAIGMFGETEFLPWAIEQMNSPALARVAGDAFTRITGIDLALHDLEGGPQAGAPSGPADDPKDENVAMDADRDLRWPDMQTVKAWWTEHQGQFSPGTAYLCGQPSSEGLPQVLATGRQRYRVSAALLLAAKHPGKPLFNSAAPSSRQVLSL